MPFPSTIVLLHCTTTASPFGLNLWPSSSHVPYRSIAWSNVLWTILLVQFSGPEDDRNSQKLMKSRHFHKPITQRVSVLCNRSLYCHDQHEPYIPVSFTAFVQREPPIRRHKNTKVNSFQTHFVCFHSIFPRFHHQITIQKEKMVQRVRTDVFEVIPMFQVPQICQIRLYFPQEKNEKNGHGGIWTWHVHFLGKPLV